jgi:hypothetical protein
MTSGRSLLLRVPAPLLAILFALWSAGCGRRAEPSPDHGAGTWMRTFQGPTYGALFDALLAADGHAVTVGATNHVHMPPYSGDALIMMVDLAHGTTLWERSWGGEGYEQARTIATASAGGYYVFGETDSYGAGSRDFFLLKTGANGGEEWFRTYGTPGWEWPFGMLVLANGDLFLYGRTALEGGTEDAYALRIDAVGEVLWEYLDRTPEDALILDALETAEGEIVLCMAVGRDGGLMALDPEGRAVWTRRYELDGWQFGSAIEGTEDGYLLAGFSMTQDESGEQADVWLAGASRTGELKWQTSFGRSGEDDYAQSLERQPDGTFVIGGIGRGMPLWKVDGTGRLLWERRLDDSTVFAAETIVKLPDGGFLIPGLKSVVEGRSYDAVLLRTDREGHLGSEVAPRG